MMHQLLTRRVHRYLAAAFSQWQSYAQQKQRLAHIVSQVIRWQRDRYVEAAFSQWQSYVQEQRRLRGTGEPEPDMAQAGSELSPPEGMVGLN
jgi:hypothetical protein